MSTQSTHIERGSPHLHQHLSNWRIRAIQANETLQDEELMYTANVSLAASEPVAHQIYGERFRIFE